MEQSSPRTPHDFETQDWYRQRVAGLTEAEELEFRELCLAYCLEIERKNLAGDLSPPDLDEDVEPPL